MKTLILLLSLISINNAFSQNNNLNPLNDCFNNPFASNCNDQNGSNNDLLIPPGQNNNEPIRFNPDGPNGCLRNAHGTCPVSFLVQITCNLDSTVCLFDIENETYVLDNTRFVNKYGAGIANLIDGMSPIDFFDNFPFAYDQAILHDIFELNICSVIDGAICFVGGSIYIPPSTPPEDCDPRLDCSPGGGPTDSAVCQRIPEACTGRAF